MAGTFYQFNLVAQLLGNTTQHFIELRTIQSLDHIASLNFATMRCGEQMHTVLDQVEHSLELLTHAYWPGNRCASNTQDLLDLIHQINRVSRLAVHLVNEGNDRRAAQPANVHQLDGSVFDPFGRVDHHQS